MIGGELSRAIGGLMKTGRSFGGEKFPDNMRTRHGVSLYAGAHDAAGSSAEPAACVWRGRRPEQLAEKSAPDAIRGGHRFFRWKTRQNQKPGSLPDAIEPEGDLQVRRMRACWAGVML